MPLVKTLWIYANCKDLKEGIHNLAERERIREENIGFVSIVDKKSRCNVVKSILPSIEAFAEEKELIRIVKS